MEQLSARATLKGSDVPNPDSLATVISRREIEEALKADETPDLIIDVTRFEDGEPAETRNVAVSWERGDLEKLLEQAGDSVRLTFDREQLSQLFDPDFEAHGLRERVAVLAVVAATAAGATAAAQGAPLLPGDKTDLHATQVTQVANLPGEKTDLTSVTQQAPANLPGEKTDLTSVTQQAPANLPGEKTNLTSVTEQTSPTVLPSEKTDLTSVTQQAPTLLPGEKTDLTSVTEQTPTLPGDKTDLTSVTQPTTTAPTLLPSEKTDLTVATQPTSGTASDSGIQFQAPSAAEVAGIAGAIALAITGAAFAFGARGRVRPT